MRAPFLSAALAGLGAASLLADFSYEQTSRITGGAMMSMMKMAGALSKTAREPMMSTVLVKGHRMVHLRPDAAEIIDVDNETITSVNFQKKTYSVMTFEQLKQMMQDMSQRMQKSKNDNGAEVQYKLSTRDTGQTKTISGVQTNELIVTLTGEATNNQGQSGVAEITSDMWLGKVAGYDEVRKVQRLMAAKLGFIPGQGMGAMMQRPDMQKGFEELYKEAAKLDGVPIAMITRMGSQGSGQGIGTSQPTSTQSSTGSNVGNAAGTAAENEASGRLGRFGGLAGGLGGLGRHKKDESSSQQNSTNQPAGGDSGLLLEMTTESSAFSTADVDASKFEVPAGFKQVEPETQRRGR
ncbi:MAG TPA: hypothetical protein VKU01_36095 [Bryobacteraceae bacterium]|nr:hypothetical protein [Bryobacteraceae bacterium]